MVDFIVPGFNRRYVLVPMLAAIVLVVSAYFITEARRTAAMMIATNIRAAQERTRLLADLAYSAADAESGQRGYLLTFDPEYLAPYADARRRIDQLEPEVLTAYRGNTYEAPHIQRIVSLIDKKMAELKSSLDLAESSGTTAMSLQLVRTGVGLRWMAEVREEIEGIRTRERDESYRGIYAWQQQHLISRYIAGVGAALNVILLLVAGVYISRDIERRNATANDLNQQVMQRTAELSELSTHLQRVTEREKSQLARELHDELGGLLVAIKMDLSQLAKQFDFKKPEIQPRWQRIQEALNAGVDLKRRVIEELRPTLLDNMGLISAVRWQAEQTCAQAGVTLQATFSDEEPVLDTNVSIAIFRVAQEALANIVKHAQATVAKVDLQISDQALTLTVEDNGVGIPITGKRNGAHGMLSMRHRMQAIGGTFYAGSATPRGTRIIVRLPLGVASAIAQLA